MKSKSVVGVTTNPTIFAAAIADGERYDDQVRTLVQDGADVTKVIFELTTDDVRNGCDVLAPVAESTAADGRVSIEVDPDLPTTPTARSRPRRRLANGRPANVLIKIPATNEGCRRSPLPRRGHQRQRHPDLQHRALPRGDGRLPDRPGAGPRRRPRPGRIHSVASFFVSRVDTEVDQRLEAIGTHEALALRGKAAIANARLAYAAYEEVLASDRWQPWPRPGANTQRPLWASTGVKNEAYPDTLYVTELVVADTVNTMPEKTMDAFADHGEVEGDQVIRPQGRGRGSLR